MARIDIGEVSDELKERTQAGADADGQRSVASYVRKLIDEGAPLKAQALCAAHGIVPLDRQAEILTRNPGTSVAGVVYEEIIALADHPDLEFVACADLGCWVALRRDLVAEVGES